MKRITLHVPHGSTEEQVTRLVLEEAERLGVERPVILEAATWDLHGSKYFAVEALVFPDPGDIELVDTDDDATDDDTGDPQLREAAGLLNQASDLIGQAAELIFAAGI